jgi:hypothetical protein
MRTEIALIALLSLATRVSPRPCLGFPFGYVLNLSNPLRIDEIDPSNVERGSTPSGEEQACD